MENSLAIDKSWITLSYPDKRFIDGVVQFVEFAKEHCSDKEVIPCPCNRCLNWALPIKHDEVVQHCYDNGFLNDYVVWYLHGEKLKSSGMEFKKNSLLLRGMMSSYKMDSDETMSENPNSRTIWVSDALTELIRVSGRSRIVYETTVKKMGPLINRQGLEENSDLSKEVSEVKASMAMQMEEVRFMLNQTEASKANDAGPSTRSQAPLDSELVGKPVNVFGPWQELVAVGVVRDIDPQQKLGDRCLEEGNFLIFINSTLVLDVKLPCPHDERKTLGQIGQGVVIWPKNSLEFLPQPAEFVGKQVSVFGLWPRQLVALGVVRDINSQHKLGNRSLEEGNFLIYINFTLVPDVMLPCPHDERTTLGQIGQDVVIWPKEFLEFVPQSA